ncbi:MAG: MATE family efflux transporter [Rhodobacteraceae bacterium]|nr:MATE family efflux transporter [Paracoccaceae bacterium]
MSEPLTHRRVLAIAVPIVISNATVPILGAVDTGVVGQLGAAAPIGAVGIGAIILTTLYWIFGFLRIGISGLTAQARGQRDQAEISALLMRGLLIAIAGGALLCLLQVPILNTTFLISPASQEVESLARDYTSIRIFSAPAAISVFVFTGWLIAQERTKSVLVLQLVTNSVNIVLDIVFVLWLDFGVRGVAAATVIAETTGFALGLWLCRSAFQGGHWRNHSRIFDATRLRRMAIMNTDILIRNLCIEITFLSFLFLAADFGDVTLAANQILLQFLHVTAYALDGFAFSAESLVGFAVGARTRDQLRQSVMLSSFWAGVTSVILAAGFLLLGGSIIDILTNAEAVRAETRIFLIWAVAAPIIGGPSWMLDGIFIGATRTADMRNSMVISTIIYGVSTAILISQFGNHGLWAGMHLFFIARAVTLGLRYSELEKTADA